MLNYVVGCSGRHCWPGCDAAKTAPGGPRLRSAPSSGGPAHSVRRPRPQLWRLKYVAGHTHNGDQITGEAPNEEPCAPVPNSPPIKPPYPCLLSMPNPLGTLLLTLQLPLRTFVRAMMGAVIEGHKASLLAG